jgi:hypothetical protein
MYICEYCNKECNNHYGSGRFCSKECAHGFSTKAKRKEINEKVSIKRKQSKKPKYCYSCEIEIYDRKILCNDCKIFCNYKELFKKLNIFDKNLKIANDKALILLKKEYFDNKLVLGEIRNKYKIQYNTVFFYFKKNGINLRNFSEASSLAYFQGKISPQSNGCFKHGHHTTWDGKEVYLRSSYEFDYAKELDGYKIKYEVEKIRIKYYDTIKQKNRTAIIDFFLPDLNMLVEIKSNYTLNLQNMKDRFKVYKQKGYKTKLILDHKEIKI